MLSDSEYCIIIFTIIIVVVIYIDIITSSISTSNIGTSIINYLFILFLSTHLAGNRILSSLINVVFFRVDSKRFFS